MYISILQNVTTWVHRLFVTEASLFLSNIRSLVTFVRKLPLFPSYRTYVCSSRITNVNLVHELPKFRSFWVLSKSYDCQFQIFSQLPNLYSFPDLRTFPDAPFSIHLFLLIFLFFFTVLFHIDFPLSIFLEQTVPGI